MVKITKQLVEKAPYVEDEETFLATLKTHCQITHDELDDFLLAQVEPACNIIEKRLGIATREITWKCYLDYPCDVKLPAQPIQEIETIKYLLDGEEQEVDEEDYYITALGELVWVTCPSQVDCRNDAVCITYKQAPDLRTAVVEKAVCMIAFCLEKYRDSGTQTIYGTASYEWLDRIFESLSEHKYIG